MVERSQGSCTTGYKIVLSVGAALIIGKEIDYYLTSLAFFSLLLWYVSYITF